MMLHNYANRLGIIPIILREKVDTRRKRYSFLHATFYMNCYLGLHIIISLNIRTFKNVDYVYSIKKKTTFSENPN